MNIFTVSMFGHREIDDLLQLERRLAPIVKSIIQSNAYVTFFIGRNGEFDEYAASVIKRTQKEAGKESSDITLVLPYKVSNVEFYEKYYDNIIIPESIHSAHPKYAITLKNRWMVEHSSLVIVHVERNKGGAHSAMKYALRCKKPVINLHEL